MILFDVVMDGTCACLAQTASYASEKPAGSLSVGEKCPAQTEVPTLTGNSQGPPERPDPILTSSSSSSASATQLQFGQGEKDQEQQQQPNSSLSPKKKLLISSSEKEKLLSWDLDASEDSSKTLALRKGLCGPPALLTDGKPETASAKAPAPKSIPPEPTPAQPQGSLPAQAPSTFQMLTSAFRRSKSGGSNNKEASSGANVVRRTNQAPKTRPLSEGSFNFVSSLFKPASQSQQESSSSSVSTATENGHGEQRRGSELTMLLQQVALSSQRPAAATSSSKDDMAFLPRRKLNFFSSLRVRNRDEVDRGKAGRGQEDSKDKDIWTILSKFRTKGDQMFSVELLSLDLIDFYAIVTITR